MANEAGAPKPKASEFPKELINANGRDKWDPAKYERLAHYIFLYDYIKLNLQDFAPYYDETGILRPSRYKDASGNYIDFGLTPNSLSVEINDTIRKHYDWFAEHLKFDIPIGAGGYDIGINKAEFLAEMDEYVSHSNFIMQALKEKGKKGKDEGNLSAQDALSILRAKEDDVRDAYFNNIRKAVEGKPGNLDPETGKPKGGSLVVDVTKAMQERKDKLAQIVEESGSTVLKTLLTAGGVGLTIVSGLVLFSSLGVAVGGFIGTSGFLGGAVGKALAGFIGTVTGVRFTVKNFPGIFKSLGGVVGKVADYFNFYFGIGKYAPGPDGIPKGYRARIRRYNETLEWKQLMIGFTIPKEASNFDSAFKAYYENFMQNAKYISRDQLEKAMKDVKFNYMVTNGNALDSHTGPSPFGRERALIAANAPTERVDYNLENPNEIERIYSRRQTGNLDLEEVRKQLEDFSSHKQAFSNAGAMERYNTLMNNYTSIVMKAVDKTAFDDAFTSTTISTLKNAVANPLISERIKSGIENGENKINNTIRYITKEAGRTIRNDVNVNIGRQLSFNAASLEQACRDDAFGADTITDTSPELASIKIITQFIENYETVGVPVNIAGSTYDDAGIRALLGSVGATNTTVYNYLDYMLSKKEDSVSLGRNVLNASITNGAGNLDATSTVDIENSCKNDLNVELATDPSNLLRVTAIANSITTTISRTSSEADIAKVEEDIAILPNKYGRTKDYLVYLLYKKAEKTKTKDEFNTAIFNLKVDDLKTSKFSQLRKDIMNSKLSTRAKLNAVECLNEQVSRLEKKERYDLSEEVYELIKRNSFPEFDEIMGEISNITYENFDSEDVKKLFTQTIEKISEPLKRYFELKFYDKIEQGINSELIRVSSNLKGGDKSLDDNASYLSKISSYPYLQETHKQRLIERISGYLGSAFGATFQTWEEFGEILRYAGNEEKLKIEINKYLSKPYIEGGFEPYIKEKTAESVKIENELERVYTISELIKFYSPTSYYSGSQLMVVDKDSADTKFITVTLFKDEENVRSSSDQLVQSLKRINSVYSNTKKTIFPTETQFKPGSSTSFLEKMRDELNEIDSKYIGVSEIDKLAAYLCLKKHILEMYRYQIFQFITNGTPGVTLTDYKLDELKNRLLLTEKKKVKVGGVDKEIDVYVIDEVVKPWIDFMSQVDTKCENLLNNSREIHSHPFKAIKDYTYSSGVKTMESYMDVNRLLDFLQNNEHNQPDLYQRAP